MKSFKKYFKNFIEENYPKSSKTIILDITSEYESISINVDFAHKSSNPIDRRLNFSAYFLALIKVLDQQGENYDTIRLISLRMVKEYVRPKNKLQRILKKLPSKLMGNVITSQLLKLFDKKVSIKGHSGGFLAMIITDKKSNV